MDKLNFFFFYYEMLAKIKRKKNDKKNLNVI